MKPNHFIAKSEITIHNSVEKVWNTLTDSQLAKEYMFGATVTTDWKEGSSITWKGEWDGKPFEDKGTILKLTAHSILQYTHYSPLSGAPDLPENYHIVTIHLEASGNHTVVTLTQDNNKTAQAMNHSKQNWDRMLRKLKKLVEES